MKLWKEELFRQDIELLEVPTNYVGDVVLESPFLIIGGRTRSLTGWIKVVQLAADEQMGDLNTAAPLIETVEFPGFFSPTISCNDLFFGCYLVNMDGEQFEEGLLDVKHDPLIFNHNITFIGPVLTISKQISLFDLISDFDQVLQFYR